MQNPVSISELIAAYPVLGRGDRLHMAIRWRLCPLPAIAARIPEAGVVVDLGCGHGLFAQLLARQSTRREVYGIDLDSHKIDVASQLTLPNLHFLAEDIAATSIPPADAITILDVFYLVPYPAQEKILESCAARLARGGAIFLKEMAEAPRWKVALNWLEETLAVRLLRITDQAGGGQFSFRTRAGWQSLLGRLGFAVETIPLDRGYYHPHVLFVARKGS